MALSNLSIKWKLVGVAFAITVLGLSLLLIGLIARSTSKLKTDLHRDTAPFAAMVQHQLAAPLVRGDSAAVQSILRSLAALPSVAATAILTSDGEVIARYPPDAVIPDVHRLPTASVQTNHGDEALVIHPIPLDERRSGALFFRVDLSGRREKQGEFMASIAEICVVAILGAVGLAWFLQSIALRPIHRVIEAASRIAAEQDFSIRVPAESGDEVGKLITSFNAMLDAVQKRREQLLEARAALEAKVEVVHREVGQRVVAERRLRESKERLSLALDAGGIGTWRWDFSTDRIDWDERMYKVLGAPPGSFGGSYSDFLTLTHPDDREGLDQAMKGIWSEHDLNQREFRVIAEDGSEREIAARGVVSYGDNGEPVSILGVCWDMTEYKRRAEDARRVGERARVLVEATSAVVWTSNRDGEFQEDEPSWAAYTGQERSEYQSYGWLSAFHPQDRDRAAAEWREAVRTARPYEVEARVWSQESGSYRYCVTHAEPFVDPNGEVVEWAGTVVDVHDHRQAEEDLRALASELKKSNQDLEEFAYIASHDLRAPLRAIANLADWLDEDLAESAPADNRRHLDLLKGRVARLERLIDDLLRYSRAGRLTTEIETVDVRSLLEDVLSIQQLPAPFRAEIVTGMPTLETAATPLRQVFLNLIGNAHKHHDRKDGLITISAADLGEAYEFAVADDGPGIPPEMIERAFKIFHTLKPRDEVEGSGIGLALVKRTVESYGGWVRLESAGRGCTVRFTWPKRLRDKQDEQSNIESSNLVAG